MGALTSRQHAGGEEVDIPSNSVYRYPPKSGEREPGLRGGRDAPARGGSPGAQETQRPTALQSHLGGWEVLDQVWEGLL